MKKLTGIFSLIVLMFTAACTDAALVAMNAPTWFDDVDIVTDVPYSDKNDALQKLDIYFPPDLATSQEKHPVIIFFYGGRWQTGTRAEYRFIGSAFAKKGFITVIPDYRKYPAIRFPAFVEDGAAATAWVIDHIGNVGGDASRIFLAGHSSGAHIASLVSTDPKYLAAYGKDRNTIRAFAGLAGPYAFTPDAPDLIDIFEPADRYPDMQVTTFIDGHQPPMLLLSGDDDTSVKKSNMDNLADAIHATGGCVKTKTYPGLGHATIVGGLSAYGRGKTDMRRDIITFFNDPVCD